MTQKNRRFAAKIAEKKMLKIKSAASRRKLLKTIFFNFRREKLLKNASGRKNAEKKCEKKSGKMLKIAEKHVFQQFFLLKKNTDAEPCAMANLAQERTG